MRLNEKSSKKGGKIYDHIPLYIMLAPFFIFFFLFTALPVVSSIVLSFFRYDMVSSPSFVQLSNYMRLFLDDDVFPAAVKNTLVFAVITGPTGFCLSFLLAWFVNEFKRVSRSLLSFLFFVPTLVGNSYFIWLIAFSGDSYGYVNSLLLSTGLITDPVLWLKDPRFIMPIIIVVQLWLSMGVSFLANIAGLQNVSTQMYEAGSIDGIRNRWQELWYITLPSMKHMLLFGAVIQIQSSFSVGYLSMALAGFPSVEHSADTVVTHLIDVGTIRYEMGYASVVSVFLFALMAISRIAVGKLFGSDD